MKKFKNRIQAGLDLASKLQEYKNNPQAIVLALPRGGVPVAYQIAQNLHAPLDIFIVRKLGFPHHQELAMGAIASGNTVYLNQEIIHDLHVTQETIDDVTHKETLELQRRELLYRGNKPYPSLKDKIVILVDDGIATGASMHAAIQGIYQQKPEKIVVAVPVSAKESAELIAKLVDKLICLSKPTDFYAVGLWYEDFSQTTDGEVTNLLEKMHSNEGGW